MKDGKPLPFALLQTRIGRKKISQKQRSEVPVHFMAFDLLEYEGADWRGKELHIRKNKLREIISNIGHPLLLYSNGITFSSWEDLVDHRLISRDNGSEGLMLKRNTSTYQVGRKIGDWWKWKTDPLTIDAVLIYAQKGHGRRSNLYTHYTFALRDGDKLVSFAKAYSGLTDKELLAVDAYVKKNAIEKFGPVRTVKPELVFEISFEGISESKRHKSGIAVRFPRISKWRTDKKPEDINTLDDLKDLLSINIYR
jgi:DNA ligase-1